MSNEELVKSIQEGKRAYLGVLYTNNQSYIYKIAGKYIGLAEREDLMQEGYIGLQEAADKYNPDIGVPFMSYASLWINQAMRRYTNNSKPLRIPESIMQIITKCKRIEEQYEKEYGIKPCSEDVSDALGIRVDVVESAKYMEFLGSVRSLQEYTTDEENTSLEDAVPDPRDIENDFVNKEDEQEIQAIIWECVDSLPEEQRKVLRMRFESGYTYQKTAEELCTNMNRVRKYQSKALNSLRNNEKLCTKLSEGEYIATRAFKGGLNRFKITQVSCTERTALELYERMGNSEGKPDKT